MKAEKIKNIMGKVVSNVGEAISTTASMTKTATTKIANKLTEKDRNLDIAVRFIRTIADLNFTDDDITELKNNAPLKLLSNMAKDVLKKMGREHETGPVIETTLEEVPVVVVENDKED